MRKHKEVRNPSVNSGNRLKLTIDDLLVVNSMTENQSDFLSSYRDHTVHILRGSAGVGKTFLAIYRALEDVLDKGTPYNKLIITRAPVEVGKGIGALPGDLSEKGSVYELPYYGICDGLFNKNGAYGRLKEQGVIEFMLTSFTRGLTFDNTICVVDEYQSLTYHELYSIMTRIGDKSKILFCGDTKQSDLRSTVGVTKFDTIISRMTDTHVTTFTSDDIVRSDIVREFIINDEKWKD